MQPNNRGFSLIELLVVVTIVAVLASMILVAVGIVRRSAITLSCQSNQRQLGMAMVAWATDNNGQLPPAWKVHWQDGFPVGWATILRDDGLLSDTNDWMAKSRVLLCPAGRPQPLNAWRFWDYNVSDALFGVQARADGSTAVGRPRVTYLAELSTPERVVLLSDVDGANPYWTCGYDSPNWVWCAWAAPHDRKGVFLCADLHIENHRYNGAVDLAKGSATDIAGWDVAVAATAADPAGDLIWSRQQLGLSPTW